MSLGRFLRSSRRAERRVGTRLFFATDVHGSEQCFRKFLNAGPFYDTSMLVLGGDIVGKLLIPILERPKGRYSLTYGEDRFEDLTAEGLKEITARIRRSGHYYHVGDGDQLAELEDDDHRDAVFRKVVYDSVADWVTLAEERLRGSGRRCFMAPGNDDFLEIDAALQGSDVVEFAEARCIPLDDHHDMITTGYSNPTPWDTERELPEDALRERIDRIAAQARDDTELIAVLHAPPYSSRLDDAPALDENLRMSGGAGGVAMEPVGSTAVRDFIEERQPLLGLHGHVHEGKGVVNIGRTICLNPGSEYTEGILSGAIVELGEHELLSHQFVSG